MSSECERRLASLICGPIVLIAVVSIGMLGCGSFTELAFELDGSRDATFSFWCRLQGIQYKENAQIVSLNQSNLATAKAYDVDQTAKGFSNLAATHASAARQLESLDAAKADPVAVSYRDRLVALHKGLQAEWKEQAVAATERDEKRLVERDTLMSEMKQYVKLWKERYAVMTTLKSKYNWDFDCVD